MKVIFFRLLLAFVFSGMIGYEREVSESNAGLKTHILVAIGATIVALLQIEIIGYVRELALANPGGPINVTSDASRLISQVVSGIGFLGAGAIIVTKRNISGLTTAASIWTVASLGLAIGMGFYPLAFIGFLFVLLTLFIFKRVLHFSNPYRIIVRYVGGAQTLISIKEVLSDLYLEYELTSYRSELFADHVIHENVFKFKDFKTEPFQELVSELSVIPNIVSVERTNLI